jgi:DNA-binding transcriptional MocR family regulator
MQAQPIEDTFVRGSPKYLQLARGFERQMRSGILRVGDRLPSVRQLQATHRISVATAVGCYAWLERHGYVRARPKSGFYVSRPPDDDRPLPVTATRVRGPFAVHVAPRQTAAPAVREVLDLGPAVVGPALLPMNRLNRSLRLALSAFGDHAVRYEDRRGNLRLRRQIARLVFRQGATCHPDEILVTSGSTEALVLAIRAVARPGEVIAVESPGCFEMLDALEALHMRAIEVPHIPREGVDLRMLERASRRHDIKAMIVNVTCHNPFGDLVPDAHKAAMVAFAAARDMAIIETDTFGDLLFSGERPRALKAFDPHGIVMQCCSLAHFVAPGFNLGWAHAGRWRSEVERLKGLTNVAGAALPQLAMAEFLESGALDVHLKRLRVELWRSVEAAREQVLRLFPAGTRVSRPEGGFVLWIQLPDGYDGIEVQRRAAAAGINILPGSAFSPSGQYASCIRIACGHPADVMTGAVAKLAVLLGSDHAPTPV